MAKAICDANANRSLWIEERRRGVGASDAPAILGISRFGSPTSVAAAKLGLLGDDEDAETELQRWGRFVEKPMIEAFNAETGLKARPSNVLYQREHDRLGFMMATPDGEVALATGEVGGLECKLKIFGADEWEREGVPDEVQVQAQHQMAVMGWGFVYVLGLLDGYRLRWRKVERDEARITGEIEPAEIDFWDRLLGGRAQPILTGNPAATKAALAKMFARETPGLVRLEGPDALGHFNAWKQATAAEKAAAMAKEHHRNALVALMGEHTDASLDGGIRLTYRAQTRGPYEVKHSTTFRVLREKK